MKKLIRIIRVFIGALVLIVIIGSIGFYLYQTVLEYWKETLLMVCVASVVLVSLWGVQGFAEWLDNRKKGDCNER